MTSGFNLKIPDLMKDDDASSSLGIDLLMNKKKLGSSSSSIRSFDGGSPITPQPSPMNQQKNIIDLGGDDEDDDEYSDIEVISQGMPVGGGNGKKNTQTFSAISSESDWQPKPKYNPDDIMNMKRELLYQFDRLEKKGVNVPRKFTLSSSLEEMKVEYDRLKKDMEVDASVRFQRRMLMACVTGVEFLNTRFDPFNVHLDGWSESVSENINDYDDIFEELWEKYHSKAKMAPELRLLLTLGGSAVWFHISNSMFKTSVPGIDQVFKDNPELKRQFMEATMNTMNQNATRPQPQPQQSAGGGIFGALSGLMGGFQGGASVPPPQQYTSQMERPSMRGPSNVDDLLQELKQDNFEHMNERLEMFSNASESEITEMMGADDASINGLLVSKNKKNKRRTLDI